MSRPRKVVYEYRIYDVTPNHPFITLTGDHWRISNVLSSRLHFHNCLEIGFCRSDSGFIALEGGSRIPFQTGDIFMIPRHVPHTTCSAEGVRSLWNYLFIDFQCLSIGRPEGLNLELDERTIGRCLRLREGEHPRLHFLAEALLAECCRFGEAREEGGRPERAGSGDDWLWRLYGATLAMEMKRQMPGNAVPDEEQMARTFALKPALDHIHDHYMEPCDIPELSALCHLSESHFRRLFSDIMGEPPLQFLNRTRIREACVLLDTTEEAILSISQAVGMPSISSFNRNFHDYMGVSPRVYRDRHAEDRKGERSVLAYRGWTLPEDTPVNREREMV